MCFDDRAFNVNKRSFFCYSHSLPSRFFCKTFNDLKHHFPEEILKIDRFVGHYPHAQNQSFPKQLAEFHFLAKY